MKTNYNVEDRQIRIFISSTFRDMQDERNHLIQKVFPKLRAEAAKRDVTVVPLDLRWGVNEEEAKAGKVMQICLEEIIHSHPFFIGIIGNTYGTCPTMDEYNGNGILQDRFGWVKNDIAQGLSYTEIEMQFGVLRNEENIDAYFYILKDDTPAEKDAEKLERLKQSVRKNKQGYPVYDYTTKEDLGEQVEKDFMALLDRLYPEGALSELEKERLAQKSFLRDCCRVYIPNEENFKALNAFRQSEEKHFVVTGESGMGKSALIANWIERIKNDDNRNLIYHFVGNGTMEGSHQQIAQRLCNEIRDIYQLSEPTDEEKRGDITKQLEKLFLEIATKKPLLIVLDGINQLADVEHAKLLNWLPEPARNTKILFSTLKDDETMQVFEGRHYPIFTLQPLSKEERTKLIECYLGMYRKKFMPEQVERIVSDKQNENTLVLKTMLDELVSFGVYEELDHRIDYYLKADSIDDFYQRVLLRYETDYDKKLVRHILSLLIFSRSGLSEQELIDILGIKDKLLPWSQFYCAFCNHLTVKNSLITFSHAYIRQSCENRYANNENAARKEIVAYFKRSKTPRAYEEQTFQYNSLSDYDNLFRFLTDLNVFNYWNQKNEKELGKYWRILKDANPNKYSIRSLLNTQADCDADRGKSLNEIGLFIMNILADYPLASEFINKSLEYRQEKLGEENAATANSYNSKGAIYFHQGDYHTALEYFNKSLCIRKKTDVEENMSIANLYGNIGACYSALGLYTKALEFHNIALQMRLKICGENNVKTASSYRSIGVVYFDMDNYDKALWYYNKSLQVYLNINAVEENPEIATLYSYIGAVYENLKNRQKALECYQEAIDIRRKTLGELHPDIASSYCDLGDIYNEYDSDKALEFYNKALKIRMNTCGKVHKYTATLFNKIGGIYFDKEDFNQALEYYKKALDIRLKIFGNNHISVAISYNNIGLLFSEQGRYDLAIENYRKALEIDINISGENHSETATTYNNMGIAYAEQEKYQEALFYFEKALEIRLNIYGETHPDTRQAYKHVEKVKKIIGLSTSSIKSNANNYVGNGYDCLKQGKYSQALDFFKKELDLKLSENNEENKDTAFLYCNIGVVYYKLGDVKMALEYNKKALDIRLQVLGTYHEDTASSYKNMAMLNEKRNNIVMAFELYSKGLEIYRKLSNKDKDFSVLIKEIEDKIESLSPTDPEKQYDLGYKYYNEKNYEQAMVWWRKAAEQGYGLAQNNLGACYWEGVCGFKDYELALTWLRKAAEQGIAAAQNNIGSSFYVGKGVPQNYEFAVRWYYKAAEQGYADAQFHLGICYEKGDGVKKNLSHAIYWYQKAADQGHEAAQEKLTRFKG